MSEAKAAFAERTMSCFKSKFYRYMEDNAHKYSSKMSQFIEGLNSSYKLFEKLYTKNCQEFRFFCPFRTASQYEKRENPISKIETEFSSRIKTWP